MRVVLLVFVVTLAVAYANECHNGDASACSVTCTSPEVKACEHGVCTCAPSCRMASDCSSKMCETHTDPMGHVHHEESHCIDGACVCTGGQRPPGPVGK